MAIYCEDPISGAKLPVVYDESKPNPHRHFVPGGATDKETEEAFARARQDRAWLYEQEKQGHHIRWSQVAEEEMQRIMEKMPVSMGGNALPPPSAQPREPSSPRPAMYIHDPVTDKYIPIVREGENSPYPFYVRPDAPMEAVRAMIRIGKEHGFEYAPSRWAVSIQEGEAGLQRLDKNWIKQRLDKNASPAIPKDWQRVAGEELANERRILTAAAPAPAQPKKQPSFQNTAEEQTARRAQQMERDINELIPETITDASLQKLDSYLAKRPLTPIPASFFTKSAARASQAKDAHNRVGYRKVLDLLLKHNPEADTAHILRGAGGIAADGKKDWDMRLGAVLTIGTIFKWNANCPPETENALHRISRNPKEKPGLRNAANEALATRMAVLGITESSVTRKEETQERLNEFLTQHPQAATRSLAEHILTRFVIVSKEAERRLGPEGLDYKRPQRYHGLVTTGILLRHNASAGQGPIVSSELSRIALNDYDAGLAHDATQALAAMGRKPMAPAQPQPTRLEALAARPRYNKFDWD
ncbi:MAG: hypothetical protein WDO70_05385 [Alphaproteobacteria bacterium]